MGQRKKRDRVEPWSGLGRGDEGVMAMSPRKGQLDDGSGLSASPEAALQPSWEPGGRKLSPGDWRDRPGY